MRFFRFGTRFLSVLSRVNFVIPTAFQYDYYQLPDRYTTDQVPYQNMHITHTLDLKGARSVQIVEEIGDAKQWFATPQVTGRTVNPQNIPLFIIFHVTSKTFAWLSKTGSFFFNFRKSIPFPRGWNWEAQVITTMKFMTRIHVVGIGSCVSEPYHIVIA